MGMLENLFWGSTPPSFLISEYSQVPIRLTRTPIYVPLNAKPQSGHPYLTVRSSDFWHSAPGLKPLRSVPKVLARGPPISIHFITYRIFIVLYILVSYS